jgi:hypothetical protein
MYQLRRFKCDFMGFVESMQEWRKNVHKRSLIDCCQKTTAIFSARVLVGASNFGMMVSISLRTVYEYLWANSDVGR